MPRKIVSGIILILLLMSTVLFLLPNLHQVKAKTIYIRADGSIYPPYAPISTSDNITYVLTGDICDEIVIERDNIVIDGAGYTVFEIGGEIGIDLSGRNNVTVKNIIIKHFSYGIYSNNSSNIIIIENKFENNSKSIWLRDSQNSTISKNSITLCSYGISVNGMYNKISKNIITNSKTGIGISGMYNKVSENNVTNNDDGIHISGYFNKIHRNIANNNLYGITVGGAYNKVLGNIIENNGRGGIIVGYSNNSRVSENYIADNKFGINLSFSNNTVIYRNNITSNYEYGIFLATSMNNTISENNLEYNDRGIYLIGSSNNTISGNNIANNKNGTYLYHSSNNRIYHNNFLNNTNQVYTDRSINIWYFDYPLGGNFWSDYDGSDSCSGPYQNETGNDGISDTPYVIDESNIDRYPLMGPFGGLTREAHNVTVYPSSRVCLIFENVTQEGSTTVSVTDDGPEPPSGFKLAGKYYDIETTANYAGKIKIRIIYDDTNMTTAEEMNLRLMQWNESSNEWVDITIMLDMENNVIYGETTHLSIFALTTVKLTPSGGFIKWKTLSIMMR